MVYVNMLLLVGVLVGIKFVLDELADLGVKIHELKNGLKKLDLEISGLNKDSNVSNNEEIKNSLDEINKQIKLHNEKLKELDDLGREILFTHPSNKRTFTFKR